MDNKKIFCKIILKKGKEKPILNFHPWIFSGAIARMEGNPESGETVEIYSNANRYLATGFFSPESQIRVRVWSWNQTENIDEGFFKNKIEQAINLRREFSILDNTDAIRLVHGESDGLPGLVIDRFVDLLVVQISSAGIEKHRELIFDVLKQVTGITSIYERSDLEVRKLEGLNIQKGWVSGEREITEIEIIENGLKFLVPFVDGHKTGYYLDQRESRLRIRNISKGKSVLDCFSYSGGFAVNAIKGGATSAILIDSSSDALALAERNFEINNLSTDNVEFTQGDVFELLRKYRDMNKKFDLIILDPPKFAPTRSHADKAARGYKDINLLAFKLLNENGMLATFSCSGGISPLLFQKIVAGASFDAGITPQIIGRFTQDSDHPVGLNFPEGEYLKGLLCKK